MNTKKPKVRLWSVLTALTAILTIAAIVGNMIAKSVRHHPERCFECIDL